MQRKIGEMNHMASEQSPPIWLLIQSSRQVLEQSPNICYHVIAVVEQSPNHME